MFIMDVPNIPAQEPLIVLAQAAASVADIAPSPDFLFKVCIETESTGDPMSAMRGVDPVGMLSIYLEQHDKTGMLNIDLPSVKTTLLQNTTHGKLNRHVAEDGYVYFMYDPTPDYVGNDRAVFQAEFEGKVYKIVVELHVFIVVDEHASSCPRPQLIKVKKPATPSSGVNGYDLNSPTSTSSAQASASLVAGITVTFADLEGAAIGQTVFSITTLSPSPSPASGRGELRLVQRF